MIVLLILVTGDLFDHNKNCFYLLNIVLNITTYKGYYMVECMDAKYLMIKKS